ncbi:MAG TPA: hypothetical protein PLQ89_21455 [Phycisphaerae bacterium]|nr:hypothetical protein [Phycisphaerae bacterium]
MNCRPAIITCVFGLILLGLAPSAKADLIAATSFEPDEGYSPPDRDVRNYPYATLTEPGDWDGNTFAGTKGGDEYTGTRSEGPGTAFAGEQFMMIQRSGADSDGDLFIRRKFPVQSGAFYCRWALRVNSTATQPDYWEVNNNINFSIDRKINNNQDGSDSHVGTEAIRFELQEDGRITIKQASFGSDITLAKRWDGTTTDGSAPIASALNNWVKVEIVADIPSQRFWMFWNGEYLGTFPFRRNLSSGTGKQINMLRFQVPRLNYAARGERLCIDDIELRTDPPAALAACLLTVTPADLAVDAQAGQPSVPEATDYTLQNVGLDAIHWTATTLDEAMNPAVIPWLTLSATEGTLASMETTTVTAAVNATGLPGGTHVAHVKFTDNCNPANELIRQVRLVVTGCTWTLSSCNQVRSYLEGYPDMSVADVVYRITNTGQQPMTYTVTRSGSSCVDGLWTLSNDTGTLNGGESADVIATFNREALAGQSTDDSYTCNLLFADNCSAQTVSRTIRLRYYGADDAYVFRYNGNVDPLVDGSAGPGLRFDLYREDGLSLLGAVENDPDAYDGKVFRIQDDSMSKVKYRLTKTEDGNPVEIANEIGATIVARVKVASQLGARHGGLFLWEEDAGTCAYHWGGIDGVVQETQRNQAVTVPGTTDFVTLRLTSIGRPDDPWDCSRIIRLYLNEDPTPVLELVGAAEHTTLYEGLGFGAGSTSGEYDIAFDWIAGTNVGAFAPGEEETVLGFSLVGKICPVDWADFDGDGDVDQVDFGKWQRCFTSAGDPTGSFDTETCGCADRDRDGDVDINDAGAFIECATGPHIPFDTANPPAGCH